MASNEFNVTIDEFDRASICIIDDNKINLDIIRAILSSDKAYIIDCFLDPIEALNACKETQYDIIIVDYQMPKMTGTDFIEDIKVYESYKLVPKIMVTADKERNVRISAIQAGATEFLNKPIDPIEIQIRVKNLLELREAQVKLSKRAVFLSKQVDDANRRLLAAQEEMIFRLANAIEMRDDDTGEHISRVASISRFIAEGLNLSEQVCQIIQIAAPIHDIGKIGIPDAILKKPSSLTKDEWSVMKEHTRIGGRLLSHGDSDLLKVARDIAMYHHEKWDGNGYNLGLAGEEIPLSARIVAIADVFDALCSQRPYKKAWPLNKAYSEIEKQSGIHFDPKCVEAFKKSWDKIVKIY